MRSLVFASLLAVCSLAACGGDDTSSGDDVVDPDADPTVAPDADFSELTELVGRDWTIPAGEEIYRCIRIQVPEDSYVSVFQAQGTVGEHHQVLTIKSTLGGFGGSALGEYDCEVSTLDLQMLFASGVGTDALQFPDGVAIRVQAGHYINLNLHLFNANPSEPLTGHSGIYVKTIPQSEVVNEAEMVFAGTMQIDIPGETGSTPYKTTPAGCTFSRDATIFSYWPHSHQFSTHHKVTFTPSGGSEMVLHDDPYDFNEQINYPLSPSLVVGSGDRIEVECTYENHTGQPIGWGDSSTAEMCFTGLYRYPKQALSLYDCVDDGPF